MTTIRSLLLGLALTLPAAAQATVYKCVDDSGRVTYTNDRSLTRGCQPLSSDLPVSSVPAARPAAKPAQPSSTPGSFPRVSPESQRARDNARKDILNTELQSEEAALEEARTRLQTEEETFPPQERNVGGTINAAKRNDRLQPFKDQIELHERNIESIKRELSRLR